MCDWCHRFGEEGGNWHLNPANYARRLYKIRKEESAAPGAEANPQTTLDEAISPELLEAKENNDLVTYHRLVKELEEAAYRVHFGQVVTLDELLKALDLVYPICLMACGCRRISQGLSDEENFTCIGMGPGMYKWERWPETYRGGVEFVHPDDARELLSKLNKRGFVQTVFTFGTPYLAGICNCEYPDCLAIRHRLDYGIKTLWKGHLVARVQPELCTGCGVCASRCQFRAINLNPSTNVAYIDMSQCFGCGQCLNACKPEAISLVERRSMPALANAW